MSRMLLLTALSAALLAGCGRESLPRASAPGAPVTLRSALIEAAPKDVRVSCAGGGFCRESIFAREDASDIDEAREDCERRRGKTGSEPCPQAHVLARCAGSGTQVVTYEQADPAEQDEAVSALTSLCEAHGGTLETGDAALEHAGGS